MKKVNKLKVLTIVLMGIIILCSARMSFAATSITSISTSSGNSANNAVNNIATNNTSNNVVTNENVVKNEPNYNNVVNNTTLPDTGAKSSIAIFVLILLTSVSAVYTYIKVKQYNI